MISKSEGFIEVVKNLMMKLCSSCLVVVYWTFILLIVIDDVVMTSDKNEWKEILILCQIFDSSSSCWTSGGNHLNYSHFN